MKTKSRLFYILLGLFTAGLACNLPSTVNSTPQAATLNALYNTSAAQTVNAVELTSTPIQTPVQTSTVIPSPTNPVLTFMPIDTSTSTILCDAASFIKDVTIPDGMVLGRGTNFTKTWRIQNVGSCSWTPYYSVVFVNGDGLSAPTTNYLGGYIAPGNYVDLSVNMVTPNTDGHYRGFWEQRNSSGALFGIGPQANNPFWIDINVSGPSYTAYDFALINRSNQIIRCAAKVLADGLAVFCNYCDLHFDFLHCLEFSGARHLASEKSNQRYSNDQG